MKQDKFHLQIKAATLHPRGIFFPFPKSKYVSSLHLYTVVTPAWRCVQWYKPGLYKYII